MSKKARLGEYLAAKRLTRVAESDWRDLLALLQPITRSYLRRLLAQSGLPVQAPFGGVHQKSLEELEQSLIEMEEVYARAKSEGNRERADQCRRAVIEAKDHARLSLRSPSTSSEKKALKQEMVEWMLVWLENPGVFPAWVKLRRLKISEEKS